MKLVKYIVFAILLLIAMLLSSTLVMKILDIILHLNFESIFIIGFKVDFISWLVLLILIMIIYLRKNKCMFKNTHLKMVPVERTTP